MQLAYGNTANFQRRYLIDPIKTTNGNTQQLPLASTCLVHTDLTDSCHAHCNNTCKNIADPSVKDKES